MSHTLTLGIIGAGSILPSHLNALAANPAYRLAGVCDRNPERLTAAAIPGDARAFEDYRDLLSQKPDVVLISVPHDLHHPIAMAALDAGCHCLIEKPLAISMEQLRDLIRKQHTTGRAAMVAETAYHDASLAAARAIVAAGALGRFLFGQAVTHRYYFEASRPSWFLDPARSGGGKFINVGMHRIATVRRLLGDDAAEVAVTASVHPGPPPHAIEAATMAMVSYADGSAFTYEEGGRHRPPEVLPQGLRLVFERGQLGFGQGHVWTSDRDGRVTRHAVADPAPGGPYAALYAQMAGAIAGEPHYPTLLHGARDVRVALAAYASALERRQVDLRTPEWQLA